MFHRELVKTFDRGGFPRIESVPDEDNSERSVIHRHVFCNLERPWLFGEMHSHHVHEWLKHILEKKYTAARVLFRVQWHASFLGCGISVFTNDAYQHPFKPTSIETPQLFMQA